VKRSPLLRKAELRSKYRTHKDPVTPEMRAEVAGRDGSCVMSQLDPTHVCRDTFGNEISPFGEYEIDHIDTGGVGKRGPSVPGNLVRLCPWGHAEKTYNARKWRPVLREWAA
jgi:hypothetical protein